MHVRVHPSPIPPQPTRKSTHKIVFECLWQKWSILLLATHVSWPWINMKQDSKGVWALAWNNTPKCLDLGMKQDSKGVWALAWNNTPKCLGLGMKQHTKVSGPWHETTHQSVWTLVDMKQHTKGVYNLKRTTHRRCLDLGMKQHTKGVCTLVWNNTPK